MNIAKMFSVNEVTSEEWCDKISNHLPNKDREREQNNAKFGRTIRLTFNMNFYNGHAEGKFLQDRREFGTGDDASREQLKSELWQAAYLMYTLNSKAATRNM